MSFFSDAIHYWWFFMIVKHLIIIKKDYIRIIIGNNILNVTIC